MPLSWLRGRKLVLPPEKFAAKWQQQGVLYAVEDGAGPPLDSVVSVWYVSMCYSCVTCMQAACMTLSAGWCLWYCLCRCEVCETWHVIGAGRRMVHVLVLGLVAEYSGL